MLDTEARPVIGTLSSHELVALSAVCLTLLWIIHAWMLWQARHVELNRRLVASATRVVDLAAFLVPPVFSTAIFGRIGSVYRLNPHLLTAREAAPSDPVMPYIYWQDIPSPYGPVWTQISWLITFCHDDQR